MQQLTSAGNQLVNDLSYRYNLSTDAIIHMLIAVNQGGGYMAQFSCPELGGSGQWMRGGMTMVGDMFNHGLKMTVDNLCCELSNALANIQVFPVIPHGARGSNQWWPADLGQPLSSGAQNNTRYAIFPRRLAVEVNGQVTVYDTLDINIGGVSQQQGGNNALTFSSQYGTIAVSSLPVVSGPGIAPTPQMSFLVPDPQGVNAPQPQNSNVATPSNSEGHNGSQSLVNSLPANADLGAGMSSSAIIDLIGKLAHLRDAGAITDAEFNTKKSELLSRL